MTSALKRTTNGSGAAPASKRMKSAASETAYDELDEKCVNTIRTLSIDMVQKANSGHPGAPLGCAPFAYLLWKDFMRYSPSHPHWTARDRFVLSNGHACALQYSMLFLTGYNITTEDLKGFRQVASITPGHPENHVTPGVEVCTGPLGQGISQAVGMAIAERHLASVFNKPGFNVVDNHTWVICGDGCLQEGVSSEASSLAGHLGLGKLIVLYDDNSITIDGDTSLSFTEDVAMRYTAYGWHVQAVDDGTDLTALHAAIEAAKAIDDKPSIIKIKTKIGYGSTLEGSEKSHGAPLGEQNVSAWKSKFGFNPDAHFSVDGDVEGRFAGVRARAESTRTEWSAMFERYTKQFPELAAEYHRRMSGQLKPGWEDVLPRYKPEDPKTATRKLSAACLAKLATHMEDLVGGSADLTPSNGTGDFQKITGDFQNATPNGRYLRFGVREHGMTALCNGIAAYGGIRIFCATFLNFIGYALGAVRVTALSKFPVLFVATHDSIMLGEDGPTHQPIEMLESTRSMPNMQVIRPADGNEVSGAYMAALSATDKPTILALTRQGVPHLAGSSPENVLKGGYVVVAEENPQLILVGSGSEVSLCVDAAKALGDQGMRVRVVSMPCTSLFDQQTLEYKLSVFKEGVPIMAVEAAGPHGWAKYSHSQLCMTRWGASGKGSDCAQAFGFTVENVVNNGKQLVEFYSSGHVPCLVKMPGAIPTPDP